MLRSVSSPQRKVRMLTFICDAAGTSVTGLDANRVTLTDTGTGVKTITLVKPFAAADYTVQVTNATAASISQVSVSSASVFLINSFAVDGTTPKDAITHVTVIGSDVATRY